MQHTMQRACARRRVPRTEVMPAVVRGAESWLTSVSEGPRPREEGAGSGAPHTEMVVTKEPPLGLATTSFL